MKISAPQLAIGALVLLSAVDFLPWSSARIGVIGQAQAVVGMPMTPLSVAGVARRTALRTTAVATTAAATSAAAASAPRPAPPPAATPLPVGTVVAALPSGCVSAPVSGVEYYLCGGTYYRAAFQGNNLVYVVQRP